MILRRVLPSALVVLAAVASQANAALISSNLVNDDPLFFDSSISASLVTAGQSSLVSLTGTTPSNGFALGGVNNGTAVGFSLGTTDQNTLTFFDGLNAGAATVTFQLDRGYNITSISSIAGWGDTYFGSQQFTVQLEIASSGTFATLGSFGVSAYTPPAPVGNPEVSDNGFATLTTITENTTGIIASNVTGIRFLYTDPYPSIPQFNGTVIREISVVGSPTPEPSTALMLTLGSVAAFVRRRRA